MPDTRDESATSARGPDTEDGNPKRSSLALAVLPLLIGLVVSVAWIQSLSVDTRRIDFNDLALGESARSIYARVGPDPINCLTLEDASECLEGWERRGSIPTTLWFGNSQVHSINQYLDGQEPAASHLYRALAERGGDLLVFSPPSGNLQEYLVLFEDLHRRVDIETLVIAATFDDLRDTGLRPGIIDALDDPEIVAALAKHPAGQEILARYGTAARNDLSGLDDTLQQRTEAAIDAWLAERFSLWEARPIARGNLFRGLYMWRNALLGITSSSKRPVIPDRYALNMKCLDTLLERTASEGIDVLLYIIPLRQDVEGPYVQSDYEQFKGEVEELARRWNVGFADLDQLVPGHLWGEIKTTGAGIKVDEIDFVHFQEPGHRLLAGALKELLQNGAPRPAQTKSLPPSKQTES